jgi:hypothetical protein
MSLFYKIQILIKSLTATQHQGLMLKKDLYGGTFIIIG